MTPGERWLTVTWPVVRACMPAAPARVVEVGCGPLGGFVPMLPANRYDAVGIDPRAPDDAHYQRIEFERAELPRQVDAVVVVEWGWEKFDQQTAEWCFKRLGPDGEAGWLHRRRDEWLASGHEWPSYVRGWAEREGLHPGDVLVRLLDDRLERRLLTHRPYFFADLAGTTEDDEQTAIDAGHIQPTRIDYVGTL